MDHKLDQVEQHLLQMLLDGDDPILATLRSQLALAKRKPREVSAVGFFTQFDVPQEAPRLQGNPSFRFGDITADIEGLERGAGFVLFIENGALTMLEGYTYDEPWPGSLRSYKLSYTGKPQRDFPSLRATPGWPQQAATSP